MKNNKILKIKKLKKYFNIGKIHKNPLYVHAVDGINIEIEHGETLGLVGESGSGKSTVAYTIVGMYEPTAGQILFRGMEIGKIATKRTLTLKKEIQIVFQDPGSSLNPRRSVSQALAIPLKLHGNISGKQIKKEIVNLLDKVELSKEYLHKSPTTMGGGEKQMVAIARALATDPSLIILDEPTSALDVSVQAKIINKLIDLQKKMKLTYLFITHDLSLMRNVADRVAIMYLGKICEIAKAETFFKEPAHPYTKMLISSVPVISEEEERLKPKRITSKGEIPSPVHIPSGCSFHLRCPFRLPICSEVDPEFAEIYSGHLVRCHLFTS